MFFTLLCVCILIGFLSFLFENKGKSKPNNFSDGLDKYRRPFTAEELIIKNNVINQSSIGKKEEEKEQDQEESLSEFSKKLARENEERSKKIHDEIVNAQAKKAELEKYERIRIAREKAAKKETILENELKIQRDKEKTEENLLREILIREINKCKKAKPLTLLFPLDIPEYYLTWYVATDELQLSNLNNLLDDLKYHIKGQEKYREQAYEDELRRDAMEESEHQYRINSGYYNEYDD